jgi:hypothetical protein
MVFIFLPFEYLFSYYDSRNMEITEKQLKAYRANTYHMKPGQRLANARQAVEFINQRGFAFLWPIKDVELPNLWAAVARASQLNQTLLLYR